MAVTNVTNVTVKWQVGATYVKVCAKMYCNICNVCNGRK